MSQFSLIKAGTLTVGSYVGFAPVSWKDENGVARGKDIDFLRMFADKYNLNVVIHFFPFDRIWERTDRGEIDIAAAGIAPLKCREVPNVVWSEPYYTVQRSLLIRATDQQKYSSIEDFSDKVIAVTRNTTAQFDTEERKPTTTQMIYCDGEQIQMINKLLNGEIDAFAEGDICSEYMAKVRYPSQLSVVDIHQMNEPENFVFALRKESSGLLDALNEFIRINRHLY